MRSQGSTTDSSNPVLYNGNTGERVVEEEVELFSPAWLGQLPSFEYIAKLSGGRIVKGRLPILGALRGPAAAVGNAPDRELGKDRPSGDESKLDPGAHEPDPSQAQ